MTATRISALGADGMAAAALAMLAATALGVAASGAMPQPWVPLAAAGLGVAAGLLGLLGVARRGVAPPLAPPAAPVPGREMVENLAALMQGMAEEMMRLKRDSTEASRGMAEARQASQRIVTSAEAAIARLDESAESSAIAARALALLPGIADNHAQRIELMAARAEQALAQVPEVLGDGAAGAGLAELLHALPGQIAARMAGAPARDLAGLEAALARLEALPAPDSAALDAAIGRLDAMPDAMAQAVARLETRLEAAAAPDFTALEAAIARLGASPAPDLAPLAAAVARLDSLPGEIGTALAQQHPAEAARLDAVLARLEAAMPDPMLALGVMEATERLESIGGDLKRALALSASLSAGEVPPLAAHDLSGVAESLHASLAPQLAESLAPLLGQALGAKLASLAVAALRQGVAPDLTELTERIEGAGQAIRSLGQTLPGELAQEMRAAVAEGIAGATPPLAETAGRIEAAAQRMTVMSEAMPEAVTQGIAAATPALDATAQRVEAATLRMMALGDALPLAITQGIAAATPALDASADRVQAATQRMMALGDALPLAITQGIAAATPALDASADRVQAATLRMMALGDALPMAITQGIAAATPALDATAGRIEEGVQRMLALSEALPHAVAGGVEQALTERDGTLAPRLEQAAHHLAETLPARLAATLEARLGALTAGLEHAAAGFPPAAEGLAAHLAALETLGPVLDGVTDRLIETAGALAATGGSLAPMADATRRAMDALAVATQSRPAAARPEAQHTPSVAASILGRLAPAEEPAVAATLMRLDGVGREVASLLRDTEGLAGGGGLSRPAASRAPELLESLDETIRGLQSISTAIAMAADRRLDYARAG